MLRLFALVACLTLPIAVGCGPAGPTKHAVQGQVTLDGQPIAEGKILLRDPTRQVGSVEASIVDGAYELETLPGPKRVEITALKEVPLPGGRANVEGDTTTFVEAIPARYNSKSTLELEIDSDLDQQNFELTSKR
ncbi:MAG: hypothetical protein ACIALR_13035 [Blastopirellula sp. JB062]